MNWKKHNYINSFELLSQLDQYLMDGDSARYDILAVDTETNGLEIFVSSVIGFSISPNAEIGFYVPLVEWIPDTSSSKNVKINKESLNAYQNGHFQCVWSGKIYEEFFTPDQYELPEFIVPLMERWFKSVNIIFHNAPFDTNMIWCLTKRQLDLKDNVLLDTALLSHIMNENTPNGLKETAEEWQEYLPGYNHQASVTTEQKELHVSAIRNGSTATKGGYARSLWRADPLVLGRYACADTFLTFGICNAMMKQFQSKFGDSGCKWLFEDEIMPVCREVVIPMKRKGVYIDVPHFKRIESETAKQLLEIEDRIISNISEYLTDFTLGKTVDEAVSQKRFVTKLIELENLSIPTKTNKETGEVKETLAKAEVEKMYNEDPHWVWGYILGIDSVKYSSEEITTIKANLYEESEGRRYQFNIGSDAHLRWLLFTKLKIDASELPKTDSSTESNVIVSVAAETLELLLPLFPWIKDILTFKRLRKLQSTYIQPAIELNKNGWLYMDMKQNGTVTGRFACSGGFNLQTLPNIESEMESIKSCSKCHSEEVEIVKEFGALADLKCHSCNHLETDIIRSSVIKKGFIAPPGYKIVNADYASLEPRCFAFMSGDDKLKAVYKEGLDLYSKVYCDMFDEEKKYSAHPDSPNFLKKLNKSARTLVKPIVLGIPYGANGYQIAKLCGKEHEIVDKNGKKKMVANVEYGDDIKAKYLNTYKDLHKYMITQESSCLADGEVVTIFGRRRRFTKAKAIYRFFCKKRVDYADFISLSARELKKYSVTATKDGYKFDLTRYDLEELCNETGVPFKEIHDKGYWYYFRNIIKADLNNAKNFPIQGLAGHITNKGMLDTTRLFKEKRLDAWVALQIHDEIMTYAREDQAEEAAKCLKQGMEKNEFALALDIEMIADPVICNSAFEAK